jgi:hypothetical protein
MGFFDWILGRRQAHLDFPTLLDRSLEELRLKTAAHDRVWHLGDANWAVDQDLGSITFSLPEMTATAPVQIIGTLNGNDETWLWGWDHPSVQPALRHHAQIVFDYGKKHGISDLITRMIPCTSDRAWEFVALACHLAGAQGAYRGPSGSAFVFMTFGEVQLKKNA